MTNLLPVSRSYCVPQGQIDSSAANCSVDAKLQTRVAVTGVILVIKEKFHQPLVWADDVTQCFS